MQNSEDRVALGQINGAIIVVRSVVQSENRLNPVVVTRADSLARYCLILAGQVKLPVVEAHRLVLAAWVSAFGAEDGPAGEFVRRYDLKRLLHREGDTWRGRPLDEQVFGLVRLYLVLLARDPKTSGDMALARKNLETHWDDPDSHHLIRRMLQILMNEALLTGSGRMEGKIVILDSEEVVTPILAPPLRAEGFDVTVADDVVVARQLVKHVQPDVILAERQRHMVDGLAFCREVKENPGTASILFFIMSDKGGKKVEKEGVVVGCDGVLTRPVDFGMLTLKIRKGLSARAMKGEARSSDGFAGNLSEIGFTDMIQIVCAGGRTLVIELARGDDRGAVYISKGDVIHAVVGDLSGSSAFHALMRWKDGTFNSRQEAAFPERTIKESVMRLLLEGARLADEGRERTRKTDGDFSVPT